MAPIRSDVLCPNSETAAALMSATPAMSKPYSTSAAPFLFLNILLNTVLSPGFIGERLIGECSRSPAFDRPIAGWKLPKFRRVAENLMAGRALARPLRAAPRERPCQIG